MSCPQSWLSFYAYGNVIRGFLTYNVLCILQVYIEMRTKQLIMTRTACKFTSSLLTNKIDRWRMIPNMAVPPPVLRLRLSVGISWPWNLIGFLKTVGIISLKILSLTYVSNHFSTPNLAQIITSAICLDVGNLIKSVYRELLYKYVKCNELVIFCTFWFFCTFPFLSFFLVVAYSKNDWTDFNAWWLIWRGFAQGSAFWGSRGIASLGASTKLLYVEPG